jgi:hypothetical protein
LISRQASRGIHSQSLKAQGRDATSQPRQAHDRALRLRIENALGIKELRQSGRIGRIRYRFMPKRAAPIATAKVRFKMEFGDLFSFDKKIAPTIIKPLYWIGLVLIVLGGVIFFFTGFFGLFTTGFFYGLWTMITSVIGVVFGVLGLRIAAEICLAVFEIHERTIGSSTPAQM